MPATLYRITDETADRLMEGLRAGKTPRMFAIRPARLEAYLETHPDYAAEARPLVQKNSDAARKRKGKGRREDLFCQRGHPFAGENLGWMKAAKGCTSLRRFCKACNDAAQERGPPLSADQVRRVTEAVKAGRTITSITNSSRSFRKLIVTFRALKRYRIENPDYDRFIIESARNEKSRSRLLRCQIVPANASYEFSMVAAVAVPRDDLPPYEFRDEDMAWILSLVPSFVPAHARGDVLQDIFLALTAREISRDEVPRKIARLSSKHSQRRTSGRDIRTPWSLDEPAFAEGFTTRGDNVTRGLWD